MLNIKVIRNELMDYFSNSSDSNGIDTEVYAYSEYDFDALVDALEKYGDEHDDIESIDDIDSDTFIDFLERFDTNPNITDNDGNIISIYSWDELENQMVDDDRQAYRVMNAARPCSAQELFNVYSKEYGLAGEVWRPNLSDLAGWKEDYHD